MKYISIITLASILILASCGKKEETQNTNQTQQQTTNNGEAPQQTTNNGQTPQQQTNNNVQTPPQQTNNGEAPNGQAPQTTNQTSKDTTKKDVKKSEDKKSETNENNKSDADKKNNTNNIQDSKINPTDNGDLKQSDIDFASIYAKKCAKCHGKNGHGKPDGAPNLTADSVRSKSDAQLLTILKNGIKAKNPEDDDMPAWKGKLSEDELQAAIKYIRSIP